MVVSNAFAAVAADTAGTATLVDKLFVHEISLSIADFNFVIVKAFYP
ncbi:hypothetical protein [Lactobacillus huangpiensis]|nr:hypothetical protein [Lactobacillus huangpiensis]